MNYQDLKGTNRFGNTNSHMPFISAGSDVVKVGRDQRDLIPTCLCCHHLVDVIGEEKPKKRKRDRRVPAPLAADGAAGWRRGGGLRQWQLELGGDRFARPYGSSVLNDNHVFLIFFKCMR